MQNLDFTAINMVGSVLGLFSIFIGIKYPDWDFKLKLKHRSILTHSPIILILFVYLYLKTQVGVLDFGEEKEVGFRYFIMGFSTGMGIHFLYDLFPKGWRGTALLHIPILNKKVKKKWSIFLFIIFTIISFVTTIKLSKNIEEVCLFLFLGLVLLWLNKRVEGKIVRPTTSFLLLFIMIASYIEPKIYQFVLRKLPALLGGR